MPSNKNNKKSGGGFSSSSSSSKSRSSNSGSKRSSSSHNNHHHSKSSSSSSSSNSHNNNMSINDQLRMECDRVRELLRSINQAQALAHNRKQLFQGTTTTTTANGAVTTGSESATTSNDSSSSVVAGGTIGGTSGLLDLLHTSAHRGIELNTINTRRELYGMNMITNIPRKSFYQLFIDTFDDATLQILIVAATVSLIIGIYDDPTTGYVEGCAILVAVLIVSIVTALNDYQKESQFRELSAANDTQTDVVVIRAGTYWQIPIAEIVVGDIVCFEAGDNIPCDGVLVQANRIQIDESALTGEPLDIDKDLIHDPFVLSGCTVESGSGQYVAIAVGTDSQWGIIKSHLDKENEETPLQEKLDDMAATIGYAGMAAAAATFITMMFIKCIVQPAHLQNISIWSYALEAFIIGVTIVVVAVPEGLPLAVTISLAFSTKKMLADQNLIRHLAACETAGNATSICSDKTGTLTENRMTVVSGIFADTRCNDTIHRVPVLISDAALYYILECISCCSTARIVHHHHNNKQTTTETSTTTTTTAGGDIGQHHHHHATDGTSSGGGVGHVSSTPFVGGSGSSGSDNTGTTGAGGGGGVATTGGGGPVAERAQVIGNKTEAALLLLAQSAWAPYDDTDLRRDDARFGHDEDGGSRLFPFNSTRKRMSVLVHKDPMTAKTAVPTTAYHRQRVVTSGRSQSQIFATKTTTTSSTTGTTTTGIGATTTTTTSSSEATDTHGHWTLYHKGAAEVVLRDCKYYLTIDGTEKLMTDEKRYEYEQVIQEFAKKALRCVALAHRTDIQNVPGINPQTCTEEQIENLLEKNGLCLDAICGIVDPLRDDVIDAVRTCQNAGIFVRMVTGDNLDTACAIAKQAGILTSDGISMIGEEFRKLTPKQLDDILPKLQVLARSSPEDKNILVQRLNGRQIPTTQEEWSLQHPGKDFHTQYDQLLPGYKTEWNDGCNRNGVGEVVGVTGDGTNDGPALKAADVGLSMGLSGTDVAKKASDIIIMDDKFSSIVKAVLWGRSVFDNIRKFLQFQLTVNIVALTITFLSAVVGYQPPLNAVMMLWVNLIMDTMGALALGTEPPSMELLDRRPYKRDASLISRPMWRNILCQAIYQLMVLLFLLNRGPTIFHCIDGSTHHFSLIFNAFVFCQVFNEFNAREIGDRFDPIRSITKSPMFLLVILFTITAQWFIIEYGGDFTQTYPLNVNEWKYTIALGAGSLPVGFIMRLIPVQEDPDTFAGIEPPTTSNYDDEDEEDDVYDEEEDDNDESLTNNGDYNNETEDEEGEDTVDEDEALNGGGNSSDDDGNGMSTSPTAAAASSSSNNSRRNKNKRNRKKKKKKNSSSIFSQNGANGGNNNAGGNNNNIKKKTNWLIVLLIVLVPIFGAIAYQLFQEINEVREETTMTHHHQSTSSSNSNNDNDD